MESIDIAQVLMIWEPDEPEQAIERIKRSIESFGAACQRSSLSGAVVLIDGAFDAARCGGDLPAASSDEIFVAAENAAHATELDYGEVRGEGFAYDGWPSESVKLTWALRAASEIAPALIRLDSDETLSEESNLRAALDLMRGKHGALVTWDTVGEQAPGSQEVGSKKHLRMFASSPTLTAGPAFHGSYKVYDDEWLALRMRGEENTGLARARVRDATKLVRIVNHPAERSAAMHEAKSRLLKHRYEDALSDR